MIITTSGMAPLIMLIALIDNQGLEDRRMKLRKSLNQTKANNFL